MVNIVAGEKIIPEFVQFNASAKNISQEVIRILKNPEEKARIVDKLRQIKTTLGEHGAPERASRIILNFLGRI
jgi:lipid-A-disaccharide synthase